jgi:hypothetical protein
MDRNRVIHPWDHARRKTGSHGPTFESSFVLGASAMVDGVELSVTQASIVQAAFDETGDTGVGPHSSRYLAVAGIVCPSLEPLRKAVMRTRKAWGKELRNIPELKAWHTLPKITTQFLTRIAALDVEICAAILDKRSARQPDDTEDWYRLVYAQAVQQAMPRHAQVTVTMDKRYTKPSLRDKLVQFIVATAQRPGATLSFVYADSQQERALQAADAVAWSIFQKYEHEDETFYRLIESKIVGKALLLK